MYCFSIANEDFSGTTPLIGHFFNGQLAGDRLYFQIDIFDDNILEKDEHFLVRLDDNDVDIHIQDATIYILDDDSESCIDTNLY